MQKPREDTTPKSVSSNEV